MSVWAGLACHQQGSTCDEHLGLAVVGCSRRAKARPAPSSAEVSDQHFVEPVTQRQIDSVGHEGSKPLVFGQLGRGGTTTPAPSTRRARQVRSELQVKAIHRSRGDDVRDKPATSKPANR